MARPPLPRTSAPVWPSRRPAADRRPHWRSSSARKPPRAPPPNPSPGSGHSADAGRLAAPSGTFTGARASPRTGRNRLVGHVPRLPARVDQPLTELTQCSLGDGTRIRFGRRRNDLLRTKTKRPAEPSPQRPAIHLCTNLYVRVGPAPPCFERCLWGPFHRDIQFACLPVLLCLRFDLSRGLTKVPSRIVGLAGGNQSAELQILKASAMVSQEIWMPN